MCVAKTSSRNDSSLLDLSAKQVAPIRASKSTKSKRKSPPPSISLKPKYNSTFDDSFQISPSGRTFLTPRFRSTLPLDLEGTDFFSMCLPLRSEENAEKMCDFTPTTQCIPSPFPIKKYSILSPPLLAPKTHPDFPEDLILPEDLLLPILA